MDRKPRPHLSWPLAIRAGVGPCIGPWWRMAFNSDQLCSKIDSTTVSFCFDFERFVFDDGLGLGNKRSG